jgi:hypothetical protein
LRAKTEPVSHVDVAQAIRNAANVKVVVTTSKVTFPAPTYTPEKTEATAEIQSAIKTTQAPVKSQPQQPVALSPAMAEQAPLAVRPTTRAPARETSSPEVIERSAPVPAPPSPREQFEAERDAKDVREALSDGVDKYSWPCIPKNLKEVKLNKEQDKIIETLLKHFNDRRSQRILIMMLEG